MRILHSLGWVRSGGVEVSHLEIVRQLRPPTYEHLFVCCSAGGTVATDLEHLDAPIIELGEIRSIFSPGRYRHGLQIARDWQPDLIHGAVMEGIQLAAVIGRLTRTPIIAEETSDPDDRRLGGHLVARAAFTAADRCLAVSPFVGSYLTDTLRLPATKVRVITYGVRAPEGLAADEITALRHQLGIEADHLVVGTVCRLFDDHKRVSDLIRAIDLLHPEHPDVHLLVVGDGPDAERLRAQAQQTSLPTHYHFVGEQIPADPYYALMDIFAIASAREAFGLVAAEAMRAGLPVVASNVGGLADIVQHHTTGLLTPPKDPATLAAHLAQLLDNPDLRTQMGTAGRRHAHQHYTAERYIRQITDLYHELAPEPSRGTTR
jgi:L-malate glycosyltransferase